VVTSLESAVRGTTATHRDQARRFHERLIRFRTVSAEPERFGDIDEAAQFIVDELTALDLFERVEIVRGECEGQAGRPAVIARKDPAPGCATVFLYAHYDVQPVGDPAAWHTEPFVPTEIDGHLYGRGSSDDKAGVTVHVSALQRLRALAPASGLGICLLFEGEEEVGSPTIESIIQAYGETLSADVMVIGDSGNWDPQTPSLTTSLRGLAAVTVTVRTLARPGHSGNYGGLVPDAMMAAARLIAGLHDDAGVVSIPGLHRGNGPAFPVTTDELVGQTGLLAGVTPIARDDMRDAWYGPAATVIGLDAPRVQGAANILLPEVRFRLSVRVAPGQTADDAMTAIKAHLLHTAPFHAQIEFGDESLGEPFANAADDRFTRALEESTSVIWGRDVARIGAGGSIPFVSVLRERFPEASIVMIGVGDATSRAHSPNENVSLELVERATLSELHFLLSLTDPAITGTP